MTVRTSIDHAMVSANLVLEHGLEPLAMFADREYATARPIDLKGFTWYGNAEDIVEQWAKQTVEVANYRPGETIKPASTFSLMPW
jgi:hypothetical protein